MVPCRANSRTSSPGGIGVLPPPRRVRITDCATSGMVSSRPASAATAENEDTPGTISVAIPTSAHRSICSCVPPHSEGSPECTRATFRPSAWARRYTATTSSRERVAESRISASARACSSTSARTRLAAQITTSASAIARAARNVSRSAAPGPAPTNVTLPAGASAMGRVLSYGKPGRVVVVRDNGNWGECQGLVRFAGRRMCAQGPASDSKGLWRSLSRSARS